MTFENAEGTKKCKIPRGSWSKPLATSLRLRTVVRVSVTGQGQSQLHAVTSARSSHSCLMVGIGHASLQTDNGEEQPNNGEEATERRTSASCSRYLQTRNVRCDDRFGRQRWAAGCYQRLDVRDIVL